jgi:predicted kinase
MIVIVFGLPGSGKSYFGSRLAEKIGAEYVNSDRVRKELFPKHTYSESEKAKVYDVLLNKLSEAIDQKKDLILDATFHKGATREVFIHMAEGQLFFIEVQANERVIRERVRRSRPYSDADFPVYKRLKKEWEPLELPHLILESTDDNIDTMLQKALKYLKNDTRAH